MTTKMIFTEGKAGKPGRNRAPQEYRQGGSNPPPSSQSTKSLSATKKVGIVLAGYLAGSLAMLAVLLVLMVLGVPIASYADALGSWRYPIGIGLFIIAVIIFQKAVQHDRK